MVACEPYLLWCIFSFWLFIFSSPLCLFFFLFSRFSGFFSKIVCLGLWYGISLPLACPSVLALGWQSPLLQAPVSRLGGAYLGQGPEWPHHLSQFEGWQPSGHIRPHYWNTACPFLLALSTAVFHDHSGGHCGIMVTEKLHGLQSLKYLLSGLLQEEFADPWAKS